MTLDPKDVGDADKALIRATDCLFDWVLSFPNSDHTKILEAVAAIHAARRALGNGGKAAMEAGRHD